MCGADNPPQKTSLRYDSRSGPLEAASVEGKTIHYAYPYPPVSDFYRYEGTRRNGTICSFCPYHQYPEVFSPEFFLLGNIRVIPTPMYGPCFNGLPSKKISCVQNQALYPPEFAGEYYYPDQKGDLLVNNGEPFPIHQFFIDKSNAVDSGGTIPKSPTDYGIGKGYVMNIIQSSVITNTTTNTIDRAATDIFQAPYLNDPITGAEQWLYFAQHFCTPGCHKNSQYRFVTVRPEDYQNKSITLSYLNRRGSGLNGALQLVQCKLCPPYHAVYTWYYDATLDTEFPGNVKKTLFATECYPWFGAIPVLIISPQDPIFDETTVVHTQNGVSFDGVSYPSQNKYVTSQACPPGTYNDVCAHSIRYWAKLGDSSKTKCKPCKDGYHTDGQSGAWYCLPPPGMMMFNYATLNKIINANNQSLLWSRRDILGYDFECGYQASHCTQCSAATGTAGYLPDQFNQLMILNNLLAVVQCPSGSYCPAALQAPIACPSSLPWSPMGSSSISNCTCAKGTYLVGGICEPCNSREACPIGFYMAGWRTCMFSNGATSGGICKACTNKPDNASYTLAGIEAVLYPGYFGVCSFTCPLGYTMGVTTQASDDCLSRYSCTQIKPGQLKNSNGLSVYSTTLTSLQDAYSVQYLAGGGAMCTTKLTLTTEAAKSVASANWNLISATCAAANIQCAGVACIVSEEASFDRDVRCSVCPSAPENSLYTSGALQGYTSVDQRATMCLFRCNSGLYINKTSNQCMSCLALDLAVCPVGYRIRGQGCLGDYSSLFSLANLSASCTKCSVSLSDLSSNEYLDYGAAGGCQKKPCPSVNLGTTRYMSTPCGGINIGVVSDCVTSCGPDQYLSGFCSHTTTGICKNCTTWNPGFHIVAACTRNTEDSQWEICGRYSGIFTPGFYCPGGGDSVKCPNGKISSLGAKSISDCYCPAGTRQDGAGGCYHFRCEDSTTSLFAPGVGYTSKFYMDLDNTMTTNCFPCGGLSFTRGDGVGFGSCVCPLQMFGTLLQGNNNVTCTSCSAATSSSCSSGYNIPNTCWKGLLGVGCQCALPPFTLPLPIGCQYQTCALGFDLLASSTSPLKEVSTGSAIYIDQATSIAGWNALYLGLPMSTLDFSITKLIVTSDKEESGSTSNIQYVLWTVKDPSMALTIWTAPLPPLSFVSYNPYNQNSRPWRVICSVDDNNRDGLATLEDIAIAQWPFSFSNDQFWLQRDTPPSTTVAAIVKRGPLLWLYLRQLTIDTVSENALWGPEPSNCGIGSRSPTSLGIPDNANVSCTTHSSSGSGTLSFYVGYNKGDSCGVAAVPVNGVYATAASSLLDLSSVTNRQITAMTVIPAPGTGVWLYIAFHNVYSSVTLVKWSAGGASESDEIFFGAGKGGLIRSLSMIWAKDLYMPIFLALVSGDTEKTVIYTADGMQRTFAEVQGMPLSTSPSALRGLGAGGLNKGLIVASGGSTIFSIPIQRCSVLDSNSRITPRFWDGQICVSHTCVRARSCSLDGIGQIWDNQEMRCTCSPGYYKISSAASLTCKLCEAGSYCQNSTKYFCPVSSMISSVGSQSVLGCTCQEGHYLAGDACPECPAGTWCPNRWDKFSCSGGFDITSSKTGIYPTLCSCLAGFIGPKCDPCPSGKYCPIGSSSLNSVTNIPVRLTVTLRSNIPTTSIEDSVCRGVKAALSQLFATGNVWYLNRPDTLERRILCQYIPSTPRSKSMIIIVLQIEIADEGSNVIYMIKPLTYNTSLIASLMDVQQVEPQQAVMYRVINNTEQVCPAGKIPTDDRQSCWCAPGYESSGQKCVSCIAGYYKAIAGPGQCLRCGVGTTSKISSSVCTLSSTSIVNLNGTQTSSTDSNIPIIVGGAVGGVVLLALLIFGVIKLLYPS